MMLRVVLAALILAPIPAHAQAMLSSKAVLGWTSNAEGRAGGAGDSFVQHSHTIGIDHGGNGYGLRGTLSFAETRYARLWQENDRELGLGLSGEWRVGPDTLGRATMSLAYHEEGQAIALGPGTIAATTPFLKGGMGLSVETRFGDMAVAAGIDLAFLGHGETAFGAPVAPLRTRADAWTVSGDMRLSHALSDAVAITGLLRGVIQTISDADQASYGRVPVRALRLAAGLESKIPLRAAFSLEAGADIVWAGSAGIDMAALPYARSEMTLALGGGFDLTARLRTSLDFENPADGYADWLIEGRAGIGYAVAETMRLEAAVFASATRSVGFDIEHKRRLGGELAAEAALADGWTGRASISHARETGFAPGFDETRLAFTVTATL